MKGRRPEPEAEGTRKTEIIQSVFESRYNAATKKLSSTVVTLEEISAAINANNLAHPDVPAMSTRNPANFFKDFIRKQKSANRNWPRRVFEAGYTAVQVTSEGRCFEFLPVLPGQSIPFPIDVVPGPSEKTPQYKIESLSIPLASRRLGRNDEPWLVQVLVRLRVLETHLALCSKRHIIQLDHLQTNVKLSGAEIDALFLATEEQDRELMVCCEAKGIRDDVIASQILGQVRALCRTKMTQDLILPIAVKALGPSRVYVVELEALARKDVEAKASLSVASAAIYDFVPPVPGIGL
jgi:hypothetical protein